MHMHQELEGYYLGIEPMEYAGSFYQRKTRTGERFQTSEPSSLVDSKTSLACSVLIVEDFDGIRALLASHLQRNGYMVSSSATARDALVLAEEDHPQIIIVDYDLSGENALTVALRLHSMLPNSYIVLMGGPGTPNVEEQAHKVGVSAILSKAYRLSELDRIIDAAATSVLKEQDLQTAGHIN
jgi:DNA-binding NtrC family response regulator